MGWFRRVMSEVELGLSLVGASFAGIDIREILRSARRDDASPPAGEPEYGEAVTGGRSGVPPARAVTGPPADEKPLDVGSGAGTAAQPPLGHPERLIPHQPLTDEERRLWSQLR